MDSPRQHAFTVEWPTCAGQMTRPHIMAGTAHSSTVGSYVSLSARLYLQFADFALRRCAFNQACRLLATLHNGWQHGMAPRAEDFAKSGGQHEQLCRPI